MADPPYKRARRPDSKQMWEESDRRTPIQSRERDDPPRKRKADRERRDYGDRDKDHNRRYRSRSPRDSRDSRDSRGSGRDRDRGRDARDLRDTRDSRGSGRGRDERGSGRDRDRVNGARDGGRDRRDGDGGRDKARERSRSRDKKRRRSRSPPRGREQEEETRREDEAKSVPRVEEEFMKSRTATPPVSFRVGAQDRDRMDTDDHKQLHTKGGGKKEKVEEEPIEDDDEIVIDDGMAAMQAMMGFGGFGTTHQKKVAGNDISAVRKEKKTEYRQYMNRVGGFNRPLSPTREP